MKKVLYSAVVLDDKSRSKLIAKFKQYIPNEYEIIAHHMTINLGEINPDYEKYLGMKVNLKIEKLGISDKAIAVSVDGFPSKNKIPHITMAVNRKEGGKPVMSNYIENWEKVTDPITVSGIVKEI